MRALRPALVAAALLAASGAAPAAVTGGPPVVVLPALAGKAPSPATGREAVALARANGVASALARPYKAELGWTAQWQGNGWWLVGVFESDWGTRFVVRASVVGGRYVHFGAGPTKHWILENAQPQVTTLYTRFDPTSAVADMEAAMLAQQPPTEPNAYPNFDPRNYTILDGAAMLVRDEPETRNWGSGPGWWFVYYARDHRTGQNVVLPVTGAGYDPPTTEGSIQTGTGGSAYGFWDVWVRNDVQPALPSLDDWVDQVIAARGWQPTGWPSQGRDETFWSVPPLILRSPVVVPRQPGGGTPHPGTAKAALAVVHANLDVADLLAEPYYNESGWTAQWRGHEWWLAGVYRSDWGKRFVVRAAVKGNNVQLDSGPSTRWIRKHASPRLIRTVYTRLKPWSAASLLKSELLAGPVSRFDLRKYSILAGSAELARDIPSTLGSGPAWYFVYFTKDLATGKNVVLPVVSSSGGPLDETTYDSSTPGSTAYGFQSFRLLPSVPAGLSGWIRSVVAKRGWHPTNFH
jgi:hypothetical protein